MKKTILLIAGVLALIAGTGSDSIAQLAGGTYTINSGQPTAGTNYASFSAAVTAMNAGISGAVTFNVVAGSGPYNEQVIMPVIAGTSATNTITFNGNNNILSFNLPAAPELATLKLNGTSYVRVKKLHVQANGPSSGYGIQIINNADNNIVDSCIVTLANNTLNYNGICINGSHTNAYINNSYSDYNTISNCTINGGYYGITVVGDNTNRITNNTVTGNTVLNAFFGAIYALGNNNLIISNNDMSRASIASLNSYYGIYFNSGNQNSRITGNKVHNFFGSLTGSSAYSAYGIYSGSNATLGNENVFANNIVYDMNGDGTQYGIYNNAASYNLYYHNTISCDHSASVSGNTYAFYQNGAASGIELKNNIFSITRGGTGNKWMVYMNTAATTFTANNNDYYLNAPAGNNYFGRINGTNYGTLPLWQTNSTQDAQTINVQPLFVSASSGNLLPNSSALDNLGLPLSIVPTDIRSIARSTTTPDMGAYEFTAPVISISGNTAICSGDTTTLIGAPAGGTWSSSAPAIATISATGALSAITMGTTTITYTTTTGTATSTITVNPTPAITPITGPGSLCLNSSITLANATPGGVWTTSNVFLAPITSAGVVNGVGSGNVVITYTVTSGSCSAFDTMHVAVNAPTVPQITGQNNICEGQMTILNNAVPGGVWASTTPAIATVNATGQVTALSVGTAQITYTVTANGCSRTVPINVIINALPSIDSVRGAATLCAGDTLTYTNVYPGGMWSSSNGAVATINVNGLVQAVAMGTTTITYSLTNSSNCLAYREKIITVYAAPTATISATNGVLSVSNTFTMYQWFKNGVVISGATQATYTPTDSASYTVEVTNQNGCSVISNAVTVVPALGIHTVGSQSDLFFVYPNPATGAVTIKVKNVNYIGGQLLITDGLGRKIWSGTLDKAELQINTTSFPTGSYFLRYTGTGGASGTRFSVTK